MSAVSNDKKDLSPQLDSQIDNGGRYSVADGILTIESYLSSTLNALNFQPPICYVYNPLEYAYTLHSLFVKKFCDSTKRIVFLGMNPGPWGMSQTGVPFGEVSMVRDWLGLDASVGRPNREHPLRPVNGLGCHRSELSGRRFWGLLRRICSTPEIALQHAAVYNHCPLTFLSESGRNLTPAELKKKQLYSLLSICDSAMLNVFEILQVSIVVAVGKYAETRAKAVIQISQELKQRVKNLVMEETLPDNDQKSQELNKNLEEINDVIWDLAQYPFSERAFELAREALAAGEVPIGCVFAYFPETDKASDKAVEPIVIGEGYNSPNQTRNPTRHAEINAVDEAIEWAKTNGIPLDSLWPRTSAIVTVEPCVMCASALQSLGFRHVRYGCRNDRFGGCGSIIDVAAIFGTQVTVDTKTKFVGGWRSEDAMTLLKDFYKGENPNAPPDKVKRKKRKITQL